MLLLDSVTLGTVVVEHVAYLLFVREVKNHLNYEHRVFNSEEFLKTRAAGDQQFYKQVRGAGLGGPTHLLLRVDPVLKGFSRPSHVLLYWSDAFYFFGLVPLPPHFSISCSIVH